MTDTNAPCPFCGSRHVEDTMRTGAVVCQDCGGSACRWQDWNRRTPDPREDGYSAGVRAALEAAARLAEQGMMSVDGGQARVEILSLALALLDAPALPDARVAEMEAASKWHDWPA